MKKKSLLYFFFNIFILIYFKINYIATKQNKKTTNSTHKNYLEQQHYNTASSAAVGAHIHEHTNLAYENNEAFDTILNTTANTTETSESNSTNNTHTATTTSTSDDPRMNGSNANLINSTYTSISIPHQQSAVAINGISVKDMDEKKNDQLNAKNSFVPKQVTLSWTSLTIKARVRSFVDTTLGFLNKKRKRKRHEVILNKIHGIVAPGQMLALMGPRYV